MVGTINNAGTMRQTGRLTGTLATSGTADLNGNPRLGGLWPDIGPVEIEARTLDCVFTCDDATDGESPLSVTFKPAMAGAPAGNCDYYWHFHNRISGAVTTIGPLAVLDTPTYARLFETGVYDVTLEARDRAHAAPTFSPDGLYLCGVAYPPRWPLPGDGRIIALPQLPLV